MRQMKWTTGLVLMLLIAGCGDSVKVRLQRAQIALSNNKPETALELAEQMLVEQPGDPAISLVKAKALLQMKRYEPSRKLLGELLANRNANESGTKTLAAKWAGKYMAHLVGRSEFVDNPVLITKFTGAQDFGTENALWMTHQPKLAETGHFLLAQYCESKWQHLVQRIRQAALEIGEETLKGSQKVADNPRVKRLFVEVDELRQGQREHLSKVFELNSRNKKAALMYVGVLFGLKDWDGLWHMATTTVTQNRMSPKLIGELVSRVLAIPQKERSRRERIDIGWALQKTVEEGNQKHPGYMLTSIRLHLVDEQFAQAEGLARKMLEIQSRNPDARYLFARALYEQKKYEEAKNEYATLADIMAGQFLVFREYGKTLEKLHDYELAEEALNRAVKLAKGRGIDDVESQQMLITLLYQKGNPELATEKVNNIYSSDPQDANAIQHKLRLEKATGNRNAVREVLETTEAIEPLGDKHVYLLMDGYKFLQEFDEVEQWARELVRRRPDVMETHIRLAEAMLMRGKDQQVEDYLKSLTDRFEDSWQASKILGALYLQRFAFDKAISLLEQVVVHRPDDVGARLYLAQGLASRSMADDALTHINMILEGDPTHMRANALAARIYQFKGERDRANEHLDRINEEEISERGNPALLAQLLLRKGDIKGARNTCLKAIGDGQTEPLIRLLLVMIYSRDKDPVRAEMHLLALLRAQPHNPQVYMTAAQFYTQIDDLEKGLLEFEKLQGLNEPLSRMAQASLLNAMGQPEDAIRVLEPVYQPLIEDRKRMALVVANTMAQIYMSLKKPDQAHELYEPMIRANLFPQEARLTQIRMHIGIDTPEVTISKLQALAKSIGPKENRVRFQVMRQCANLRRYDLSLQLLNDWIRHEPSEPTLLRWKGDLLVEMNQPAEAIEVYERAVRLQPDNIQLRLRQVEAHLANFDYPEAEAALVRMLEVDEGAMIEAYAAMGQMYIGLGLTRQAADAFDELEKVGRPRDPRIIFAMGRALAALGDNEPARSRLEEVPHYAPQYASSQIMVARIEQQAGQVESAKRRLAALAQNANTAGAAAAELLKLNLRNRQDEDLVRWSDRALSIDSLPSHLRRRWLSVRVFVAANQKDWNAVMAALDRLQRISPDSIQIAAARVSVLVRLQKYEQARLLYRSTPRLTASGAGPLLAVMVGERPTGAPQYGAIPAYLYALAQNDVATARRTVDSMDSFKTLYKQDLLEVLDRPDAASPAMASAGRQLIAALFALQAGIPQLCAEISQRQLHEHKTLAPAHGLLIQALLDMQQPTEAAMRSAKSAMPASCLALFIEEHAAIEARDFEKAYEMNEQLLKREATNTHAQYRRTLLLQRLKRYDEAIASLNDVWQGNSQYKYSAGNDLAYLLADQHPDRVDEAHQIARLVFEANPRSAPLLDTLGWIEHLRGNDAGALEYLGKAVHHLAQLPEVHYHMGLVYKGIGNDHWARYHLEQAATGDRENADVKRAIEQLRTLAQTSSRLPSRPVVAGVGQ